MARITPGPNPKVDWSAQSYGIKLSVGYKQFKFLDAAPARRSEVTRVPIGGKVFYSFLPDVRRNALTGGVEYQRVQGRDGARAMPGVRARERTPLPDRSDRRTQRRRKAFAVV